MIPLSPGTVGLPVVEIRMRPSASRLSASMLSALESRPTSDPSKYMLNVPAVLAPREVASKRRISCGVAAMPLTVTALPKDRRSESESSIERPNTSEPPTPTSEPSKNRLQEMPLNFKISTSANDTPPTLPLFAKEARRGLAETGVVVAVGVGVLVGVDVLVGVAVGATTSETSQTLPSFSVEWESLSRLRLEM